MKSIISFSTGMIVGGFIGYYICKKKHHIVSVESVNVTKKPEHVDINEYNEKIYEASYKKPETDIEDEWDEAEKVNPIDPEMVPYQISPEAFATEHIDYAKITLVYYIDPDGECDDALIDDQEEMVDIGSTIGYDAVNHFGEYEKDAVYIRNERLGNDYEVLLEHKAYNGPGGE